MEAYTTLRELPAGCCSLISGLGVQGAARRRLRELGLNDGTRVECVIKRPDGLGAYLINGTVTALRGCDSGKVCCVPAEKADSAWK